MSNEPSEVTENPVTEIPVVENAAENTQLHPREQWFRVYAYTEGEANAKGEWITPPTWAPVDKVLHVHHPDAYHPDIRVCIAHHRTARQAGVSLAACGAEQDPRMRVIEPHDEADRCPECVSATETAKEIHAFALEARKAIAEGRPVPEPPNLGSSEPEAVDPSLVDTVLAEENP